MVKIELGQLLPDGDIIIPFTYWQASRETFLNRNGHTAICINGDDKIDEVASVASLFDLIALEFPELKDGRCYSYARLLRERYGFKGELRAVGDVLRDQLFFMKRCGIDSFQLRSDKDMEDALKSFNDFTVKYQTATDAAPPVYKFR